MKIIGRTIRDVAEGVLDDGPCVILLGDLSYGFTFVGPFKDFAAAERHGRNYSESDLWTIEQLIDPNEDETDQMIHTIKHTLKKAFEK